MAPSRDEVFSKVQDVLTDALGVDAEEGLRRRRRFRAISGPKVSTPWTSFSAWRRRSRSRFPKESCFPTT